MYIVIILRLMNLEIVHLFKETDTYVYVKFYCIKSFHM